MTRSSDERIHDVRRLLRAARAVFADRARLIESIVRSTGLSPEGVELGFASLEREATERELRELVASASDADRVHVVLSANVFVAPLRALALARAAAPRVTVRPSSRDPIVTRALVEAAGDEALTLVDRRDVAEVETGEVHVYGSDATIASVRSRLRSGVRLRAHGTGMGVAVVSAAADLDAAADALAGDAVTFDQRGCLSPRIALVLGVQERTDAFADALHRALSRWGARVPRGRLLEDERVAARQWQETLTFAGRVWNGRDHVVAASPEGAAVFPPPPGRHVTVMAAPSIEAASAVLAPLAPFVVSVGSDDPLLLDRLAPPHARLSPLGAMQRPPLDGPVDRRLP